VAQRAKTYVADEPPDSARNNPENVSLFFVTLRKTGRQVMRNRIELSAIATTGIDIDVIGFRILMYLYATEGHEFRPRELSDALVTALPNVSTSLAQLEARGYVVRKRATFDKRATLVALTETGTAVAERLRAAALAEAGQFVRDWTDEELLQGVRLLQRLQDSLRDGVGK
jgi:DNA-binding MarR family transcriptional regulator